MYKKLLHFGQSDLEVRYVNDALQHSRRVTAGTNYFMLVMINGRAEIRCDERLYIAKSGESFLAGNRESYEIIFDERRVEYLEITFLGRLFHSLDNENDVLLPFYDKDALKLNTLYADDEHYRSAVMNMLRALRAGYGRVTIMSALLQLLCELYYHYVPHPEVGKKHETTYVKIARYIDAHLFERITLADISRKIYVSERCITDTVRRVCNMSFHQLINSQRIDAAMNRLRNPHHSISDIAADTGFGNYSTFYREFCRFAGMTPSEYRQSMLQEKQ